jgi:hypothetical protein
MKYPILFFSIPLLICLIFAAAAAQEKAKPQKKIRKVQRVAKPTFENNKKDDIYFKNVFKDGLVGDRPKSSSNAEPSSSDRNVSDGTKTAEKSSGWSALIAGPAIEDEIKLLNQDLARSVTTAVKFKTTYNDVRQTMALLSMSFAIIREFDAEVRWKDHAAAAQAAFERATTNARSSADQSFNYCKARKFDLEDLVRGGSFPDVEKAAEELDWGSVIGRSETMVRLEKSDNLLKEWTADKKSFSKNKGKIISEAQWVAAIAKVIAKEGMDDADVDEYVAFCKAMKIAAQQTVAATQSDDFDAAGKFANQISQSCNNCHEEWR